MKCSFCGGPFHPATGQMVGNPQQFPCCGPCFKNDIVPFLKERMSLRVAGLRFSAYVSPKYIMVEDDHCSVPDSNGVRPNGKIIWQGEDWRDCPFHVSYEMNPSRGFLMHDPSAEDDGEGDPNYGYVSFYPGGWDKLEG